jgi:hypothetical protein
LSATSPPASFPAALRGEPAWLPGRFSAGTVAFSGGAVVWYPRWGLRQRAVALELGGLRLERVRDTVPAEVLRLDRSCKVFEFDYQGGGVAIAVHPDQLPDMWALLRDA